MEKKSLNKKLQLNKETIAILDKEQQSNVLGGAVPTGICQNTVRITCEPSMDHKCTVAPITYGSDCILSRDRCDTDDCPQTLGC